MNVPLGRRLVWMTMSAAGSAAAFAVLALFVIYGSVGSGVPTAIAAALVYLAPVLIAEALSDKPLSRYADSRPGPLSWVVFVAARLVLALAIAATGSALMLVLGLARDWESLYLANRMVVVVSVASAVLIRVFRSTKGRLEQRNRELEARVEAESREAERARDIQQALMPREMPAIRGCELAAGCQPARSVGGDYYDAIPLGDGRVALAIADVCGKGMAAALLMSNLQAIVRAFAGSLTPDQLCAKANQLIAGNVAPGKYITFFYAILHCREMRIDYCNAGHNPPFLLSAHGECRTLTEGGPVLGVFAHAAYATGSATLARGDRLVLYTDGIVEAMNPSDEEFGEERLLAILNSVGSAHDARQRIHDAITAFSQGTLHDDATVLVAQLT